MATTATIKPDTTGQLCIKEDESGKILVGRDKGAYPGCVAELNVRLFETLETIDVSTRHPDVLSLQLPGWAVHAAHYR